MRIKAIVLLILPFFLSASTIFCPIIYTAEERRVLSRNYIGLGVEVYASYQCYPGETINVKVKLEALEDVKNASVTLFIWSSKSEGHNPWGTSFTVLDVTDFPNGTIKEETYNITIPSNIDPGLTYGILLLNWSVYRSTSWEAQWDKASFRLTYVKNRDYEDLQTTYNDLQDKYNSVLSNLQSTRTLMYIFLTTTATLAVSTVYFTRRKAKRLKVKD